MKKSITLFLIIPSVCAGQIQFNFENQGTEKWIKSRKNAWDTSSVEAISGKYSLKHIYDNPEAGHDQASFCIDSLHPESGTTEWQFIIRHGYDPSSSNNWSVFLIADAEASRMFPGGGISGYAIGVNYTGSDDLLKLWKINNDAPSVLINTALNWQETFGHSPKGIRVIRSQDGIWEIFVRSGSVYNKVGEGMDLELMNAMSFGIYYEYSANQDCKLWLDDIMISGLFMRDTLPPVITDVNVTGSNTLLLTFNEPLDTNSGISTVNFYAGEYLGYPDRISIDAPDMISLFFKSNFPEGITCTILTEGLYDLKSNLMNPSENEFAYYQTGWFDIIINEIMSDPSPPIGLPEFEYIELLNRCEHEVCMTDWSISCGNLIKTFPEIKIEPGGLLLIVHEDAEEAFKKFGKCLPLFTSRTSLPNTGALIELRDEKGRLISWTAYSDEWYENDYYRSGGWSLERLDHDRFCAGSENWEGSIDPAGGTPGRVNSRSDILVDTIHPEILYVELSAESAINIYFNEPMDSSTLMFRGYYFINHGIGNPDSVELSGPDYQALTLRLNQPPQTGIIYMLKINGDLKDCAGNILECHDSVKFAKPELSEQGDILISEIMFNPLPGCSEFIEIYNNSDKVIDLSTIVLAERDMQSGSLLSFTSVGSIHRLYFPGEFLVLVKDKKAFFDGYPDAGGIVVELADLFLLNDEQGTIVVLDKWLQVLEEFTYNENMHFPLLASADGVSLERISYERSSGDKDNWHSAAKDAGYCTPGYENSQWVQTSAPVPDIGVEPEIFTPDNDGMEDFTNICYSFNNPGNVISIWIFDPMGRLIRQPVLNMLAGTSGCITWDGTDDNGGRAPMGIYLVYIRIFDLNGRVSQVKKTCIISVRK